MATIRKPRSATSESTTTSHDSPPLQLCRTVLGRECQTSRGLISSSVLGRRYVAEAAYPVPCCPTSGGGSLSGLHPGQPTAVLTESLPSTSDRSSQSPLLRSLFHLSRLTRYYSDTPIQATGGPDRFRVFLVSPPTRLSGEGAPHVQVRFRPFKQMMLGCLEEDAAEAPIGGWSPVGLVCFFKGEYAYSLVTDQVPEVTLDPIGNRSFGPKPSPPAKGRLAKSEAATASRDCPPPLNLAAGVALAEMLTRLIHNYPAWSSGFRAAILPLPVICSQFTPHSMSMFLSE
jgi:hypothetical protein